jgi:geranylgeranyl pyrophosphate synthase
MHEGAAAIDGRSTRDAVKAASVAIEIFHKSSLVHDDIEDGDLMRYGKPTLHVDRGVPAAINVGDYLLGLGYRIVSSLPGVDPATLRDLVAILSDAHVRLAQGQGAELWWRDGGDKRLRPDEALAIYGLKTSPAFEAAVAMGIRLAGVQPADVGAIGRYALHVGTGFQVLNDLKDWSGDLENNRRAAGDLLGGRPTVMWALAIERLPAAAADRLRQLSVSAGRADASEAEVVAAVAEVRRLYVQAEVFERAAAIVAEQRALAAAAAATCRRGRLREVLEFLLDLSVPEPAAAHFQA